MSEKGGETTPRPPVPGGNATFYINVGFSSLLTCYCCILYIILYTIAHAHASICLLMQRCSPCMGSEVAVFPTTDVNVMVLENGWMDGPKMFL